MSTSSTVNSDDIADFIKRENEKHQVCFIILFVSYNIRVFCITIFLLFYFLFWFLAIIYYLLGRGVVQIVLSILYSNEKFVPEHGKSYSGRYTRIGSNG